MTLDSGYKGPMRTVVTVAAVCALLCVGACGTERNRPEEQVDADVTAEDLGDGGLAADDDIVQMLSPDQRAALEQNGMIRAAEAADPSDTDTANADEAGDEDGADADHKNESTSKKVGGAMMSLLAVGFSIGVMAAPYLLF
jgi:hypothetical protein